MQLIYVLTLIFGHELWVVTKRKRVQILAAELSFLPAPKPSVSPQRSWWKWPGTRGHRFLPDPVTWTQISVGKWMDDLNSQPAFYSAGFSGSDCNTPHVSIKAASLMLRFASTHWWLRTPSVSSDYLSCHSQLKVRPHTELLWFHASSCDH